MKRTTALSGRQNVRSRSAIRWTNSKNNQFFFFSIPVTAANVSGCTHTHTHIYTRVSANEHTMVGCLRAHILTYIHTYPAVFALSGHVGTRQEVLRVTYTAAA